MKKVEKSLEEAKIDLKLKQKDHKMIAFLICDQLQKNIPQSPLDYIQIVYNIGTKRDLSKDPDNIQEAKHLQSENFEAFKEIFSKVKDNTKFQII